jgi:hypothetical protein
MERILKELRAEYVKMQNKDNAEASSGVIRNQPAGTRVAIRGGGNKRIQKTINPAQPVKKIIAGGLKTIPE